MAQKLKDPRLNVLSRDGQSVLDEHTTNLERILRVVPGYLPGHLPVDF